MEAFQLISRQKNGLMQINEEALSLIETVKGPIAVCLIVGPYRSGKSFLLNNLIRQMSDVNTNLKLSNSFEVGHTDMPKTKGIQLSKHIVKISNSETREQMNLLLMDTEGTDSVQNDQWDSKVIMLSILISSLVLYNSKGALGTDSLNKLSVITTMTDKIKLRANGSAMSNARGLRNELPHFVWVVRDFSLKKTHEPDEKLMQFLEFEELDESADPKHAERLNNEIEQRNSIRDSIVNAFKSHSCVYLREPDLDLESPLRKKLQRTEMLQQLDRIAPRDLSTDFRNDLNLLYAKLSRLIHFKSIGSERFDGKRYARFLRLCVDAINSEKSFYIQDAMAKLNAQEVFEQTKLMYELNMKKLIDSGNDENCISLSVFQTKEEAMFVECTRFLESKINRLALSKEFSAKFELYRKTDAKEGKYFDFERIATEKIHRHNTKTSELFYLSKMQEKCCSLSNYESIENFESDLSTWKYELEKKLFDVKDFSEFWNEFLINKEIAVKRKNIQDAIDKKNKEDSDNALAEQLKSLAARQEEAIEKQRENSRSTQRRNNFYSGLSREESLFGSFNCPNTSYPALSLWENYSFESPARHERYRRSPDEYDDNYDYRSSSRYAEPTGEVYRSRGSANGREIYQGPRGGQFYYTSSGNKSYLR